MDSTWKYHPHQSTYETYASEAKKNLISYYNIHIKRQSSENSNTTFLNHVCCGN